MGAQSLGGNSRQRVPEELLEPALGHDLVSLSGGQEPGRDIGPSRLLGMLLTDSRDRGIDHRRLIMGVPVAESAGGTVVHGSTPPA